MHSLLEFRKGVRVAGHPLHTVLVHFPVAFLSLVFPLEVLGWRGGWETCWGLAFLSNAAGLATALPAALAGFPDLLGLAAKPKASALANLHMLVMLSSVCVFGLDLYLRGGPDPVHGNRVFVILGLSCLGMLLIVWGGWLGGELIFRHRAGIQAAE